MAAQKRKDTQSRAAQLADQFEEVFPETLPRRLEWFSDNLHIARPRFLRLMGFSPDEIEENLDTPWEVIAERWKDRAWWVRELLGQLIAFFGYDWKALEKCLQQLAEEARREPEDGPGANGRLARPQLVPPVDLETTLLILIAQGGPDAVKWLLEYLALPAAGTASERHK